MRPGTLLPIDVLDVGGQQIAPLKIVISHKPCPDFLANFAVHSLHFTVACVRIWTCLEQLHIVFEAPPFENNCLKFVVGLDDVRIRVAVFAAYLLQMVYNCRHLLVRHRLLLQILSLRNGPRPSNTIWGIGSRQGCELAVAGPAVSIQAYRRECMGAGL